MVSVMRQGLSQMLGGDGEQAEVILAFVEPQSWRGEDRGKWVVGWKKSPVRDMQRPYGRS